MELSNGNHSSMEVEEAKKSMLDSLFKTIEVAREHHTELMLKVKEVYQGFEFGEYDVHHIPFLFISKSTEEADIFFVIQQLRKYYVLLDHMTKENHFDQEYRQSLLQAKSNTDQLLNYAIFMSNMLEGERDVTDEGLPVLPEELKAEFSPSKRQRRDILTARDYGKFLNFVDSVLSKYKT